MLSGSVLLMTTSHNHCFQELSAKHNPNHFMTWWGVNCSTQRGGGEVAGGDWWVADNG